MIERAQHYSFHRIIFSNRRTNIVRLEQSIDRAILYPSWVRRNVEDKKMIVLVEEMTTNSGSLELCSKTQHIRGRKNGQRQ